SKRWALALAVWLGCASAPEGARPPPEPDPPTALDAGEGPADRAIPADAAAADRAALDAATVAPDLSADQGADVVPSSPSACGATLAVPAEGAHEIPVNGEARKFLLRLPSSYDGKKPWPVLFIFHGAGQSASYFDGNTDLRAQTEEKAVLVFPDGPVKPDGRRSWVYRSPDNVLFVDALVAWLKANLCIDP